FWICRDRRLDAWTSQFFKAGATNAPLAGLHAGRARFRVGSDAKSDHPLSNSRTPVWRGPAPVAALSGPVVEVAHDQVTNGVRQLRLRVISQRKVPRVHLEIPPPIEVLEAAVNDKPV